MQIENRNAKVILLNQLNFIANQQRKQENRRLGCQTIIEVILVKSRIKVATFKSKGNRRNSITNDEAFKTTRKRYKSLSVKRREIMSCRKILSLFLPHLFFSLMKLISAMLPINVYRLFLINIKSRERERWKWEQCSC